jgi:glucose-1-phosphate cytidylyltransferase
MRVIILAGGYGTRISEETDNKPKPMVLLDDKPILWHVMNIYACQGFTKFTIATGYKGEVIHDWVKNLDTDWSVEALDTGLETLTAGRIKKAIDHVHGNRFMVTYGDGVGNINIQELLDFHDKHGRLATVTSVRPPSRFGVLQSENGVVTNFGEKSQADAGWINGGFFVIEKEVTGHIHGDFEAFEADVLPRLVSQKQLMAFHHTGFWQPMDTLREKNELSRLAREATPPWLNDLQTQSK